MRQVLVTVILATLSIVIGCDDSKTASGDSDKPAEVRLGYLANITHGQAVLGVASGELQKATAPANLKTRIFNAGPALIEALFAGEIDVAYVGPGPAITAFGRSKGTGLRVIAGAAANGVVIVAREGSGIASIHDLKRRRIATPQAGNSQDISAKHFLKSLGQTDSNNVLAIPNAEQAGMMSRGQIDAAWAPEPWGARLVAEAGGRIIAEEKDLWPEKEFALTVVIASPEFLSRHPDTVSKLLGVHRSWTARLRENPTAYATQLGDAIFALTNKRLPADVISQSLSRVKFTDDPLPSTLATMAQWTLDLGYSRDLIDTGGLLDTSLLQNLAAPAGKRQ